jgi:hypothetical protein
MGLRKVTAGDGSYYMTTVLIICAVLVRLLRKLIKEFNDGRNMLFGKDKI